ncbi:MAG TPA: cystathionine beta-lyase [Usitatibacter sp.]|jgi:cystathionine beta-lyase|nr:cystathionine beta-lyase [Usitatibacter sp.]
MPRKSTRIIHAAGGARGPAVPVNPPVVRASTVLFDKLGTWRDYRARREHERLLTYGARGTDTAFALERALADLEGGYRTQLFPTGLAAIAGVFMAYLKPGDHLLLTDAVYGPVRRLCEEYLRANGVSYEYYAADGSDLEARVRNETRMIYVECPGSLVYEMIDLPRVARLAKARGILVAVDNTWGSGWLYNPLALGADVSVIAVTKYIGGHSDIMMGAVVTTEAAWRPVGRTADTMGFTASPDDAYLALRGLRTLGARMELHQRNALAVVDWLASRAEVREIFFPALPSHPGHDIWKRDCSGVNGLVSFELARGTAADMERMIDRLELFGIGASWGGFESVVLPADVVASRTVTDWSGRNAIVRLHIGLEDPRDLIEDLERGFAAL